MCMVDIENFVLFKEWGIIETNPQERPYLSHFYEKVYVRAHHKYFFSALYSV